MNCPHCGAEGYEKEIGCRVCLYSDDASNGSAAGDEMALPELNRMLEAMGVQPLTDVERVSTPGDENTDKNVTNPLIAAEDDIKDVNDQLEQNVNHSQPVEEGSSKKRLSAARYSAGGLTVFRQIFTDAMHMVATFSGSLARYFMKKRQTGKAKITALEEIRTATSEKVASEGEREEIEESSAPEEVDVPQESDLWSEAVESELPVAQQQQEPVQESELLPKDEEPCILEKKSKDSWLFWAGVPVLVFILAVSTFLLVLFWRHQRMEPEDSTPPIRPEVYTPWTPAAEPVPVWSVTISED